MKNLGTFIAIPLVALGLVYMALVYWVLNDARSRSEHSAFHVFAMAINLVFPLLGLVIYLLIRPSMTLVEERALELEADALAGPPPEEAESRPCPACGRDIERDFVLCPYCHTRFAKRCPSCRKSVRLGWTLCPYCASSLELGTVTRAAGQA
ncbi:MAG: zinc ribbon domain-containing protein [Candidatus Dormibacteria bacterium]